MGDELLKLAERVEATKGANRELDAAIGAALGFTGDTHVPYHPLCYTASLDAALTLVPDDAENVELNALHSWPDGPFMAIVTDWDGNEHEGEAGYFAVALTAAALRARANHQPSAPLRAGKQEEE